MYRNYEAEERERKILNSLENIAYSLEKIAYCIEENLILKCDEFDRKVNNNEN